MPPLSLKGVTLGEKHKHINKLVQDAVNNEQYKLTNIDYNESDVHNILQIDIACKTRNVDYIIEAFKCDDMLYVSRAIKHSTWLITEQEYAHIINPDYLHAQLFPHMLTKAINKLLLHIRLHLKDEKRVEQFHQHLKGTSKASQQWLLNCSTAYIENVLQNERITLQVFKRLCRRSAKFLKYYTNVEHKSDSRALEGVLFLLKSNSKEFLDVLEARIETYDTVSIGRKYTEIIMKTCPERLLGNFEKYMSLCDVDIPSLVKYIKKEDMKHFLLKYSQEKNKGWGDNSKTIQNVNHFIKNMPEKDRFEFVRKIYIDKDAPADEIKCLPETTHKAYQWYQHAPFDNAFIDLKKMIRAESSPIERRAILSVLVSCARNNPQHIKTVLQYYYDKHRNEPFNCNVQFVNNIITQTATHNFDHETWNILDKLFHSLEVYIDSENDVQICLKAIILFKVLHDENIPAIVETKLLFDTFKTAQTELNKEQQNKIFSYLLTFITNKIQDKINSINNESNLIDAIRLLHDGLILLKDWKKDLQEYPLIRNTIRELLKLKSDNSWQVDLSPLYNVNKSWRKYLFEESLILSPSEEVCLNTLKHDPQLLARYSAEVTALRANDNVSLQRFLSKLRIYWSDSFAQQWTQAYLDNINNGTKHKAIIKGLFVLLPQKQLIEIAKEYVPKDAHINWNEVDQTKLSVSKNIAKYLHIARPLTPLDVVLLYAKGDYLQFTVPSLDAILYNISQVRSREYISKLLDAPVSLQKYGLYFAFIKLKYDELKPLFFNIWQTTKNLTIRERIFTYTYNLLCKATNPSNAKELWDVLNVFIDNLSADDNKNIFKQLSNPNCAFSLVQGEFYMKSYSFLTSLPAPAVCECDAYINNLIIFAAHNIDVLDNDFVENQLIAPIKDKISEPSFTDVMSTYVLHGKTADEQVDRFRRVLVPALEQIFQNWNIKDDDRYVMPGRRVPSSQDILVRLIETLTRDFRKFTIGKQIIVPVKLFSEMKRFLEENITRDEIYVTYTVWSLTLGFVESFAKQSDLLNDPRLASIPIPENNCRFPDVVEEQWEQIYIQLLPVLGPIYVKLLIADIEKSFSTAWWLFSHAFKLFFKYLYFKSNSSQMVTCKYFLENKTFIPGFLLVCNIIPKYVEDNDKLIEMRRILSAHPSLEVRMHYHRAFKDLTHNLQQ